VRSSTSSSDGRTWLVTWGLTLLLVIGCVSAWETFWRERGFSPSVRDDHSLWVAARRELRPHDPDEVVLVGSSRTQVDINPDALIATTGWRKPIQLAVTMGSTMPMLRHLARDSSFAGIVVAEINPAIFFAALRILDPITGRLLERFHTLTTADLVEFRLSMFVQQQLILRLPALSPRELLRAIARGEWPHPQHYTVDRTRYRFMDFELRRGLAARNRFATANRARSKATFLRPQALVKRLDEIEALVETIEARGGEVIFVRFPSNAHVLEDERKVVPRDRYWDVFVAHTDALAIHFEDYPELASFTAPDGEHLDRRDAITFSSQLGKIIMRERANRRND